MNLSQTPAEGARKSAAGPENAPSPAVLMLSVVGRWRLDAVVVSFVRKFSFCGGFRPTSTVWCPSIINAVLQPNIIVESGMG